MQCEICGKDELLFKTNIEGTMMNVCKPCSKYGKVISAAREETAVRQKKKDENKTIAITRKKEIIQTIVEDYGEKVKRKREQLGLKQEELAKMIAEKESLLHHIESGKFEPNIELARKLERFLKISLVEEYEEENSRLQHTKSDELTIGDLIKVRKK
ncbi:TIGR00270 family protein [Candidatus Woesearchaeota archaeon]|nr:TIGR00270 family protein [Candidatus Woesearchaeota archaeon]